MFDVDHAKFEIPVRSELAQRVQQEYGIRAAGDSDADAARVSEHLVARNELCNAVEHLRHHHCGAGRHSRAFDYSTADSMNIGVTEPSAAIRPFSTFTGVVRPLASVAGAPPDVHSKSSGVAGASSPEKTSRFSQTT